MKELWKNLWKQYKTEWKALWNEYKSIIIPFIVGTAKYVWQLVYGIIAMFVKGLYGTGEYCIKKLIEIIKKA